MKRSTWRKHHKWVGITICFFLIMFCFSGIILNHRNVFNDISISRGMLPEKYRFHNWNNGLLRGTLKCETKNRQHLIFLYGAAGIFITDSTASKFTSYNKGILHGADHKQIRNMVQTQHGDIFAASIWGLYHLKEKGWISIQLPTEDNELITDLTIYKDTMVLLSRSYAYISLPPYKSFRRIQLQAPNNYKNEVSIFRQIWLLHCGALFGTIGKIIMDIVGLALSALCITGIWFWFKPRKRLMTWHDGIGRYTIILTLLITFTGWCLRPPLMIPLSSCRTKPIPGTVLSTNNVWNDKLRMIRYDNQNSDWLVSTSEGFFSFKSLTSRPETIKNAPPVSVMGQTVWQRDVRGRWLIGSFSGLFLWDRNRGIIEDYFAGRPKNSNQLPIKGIPISSYPISGYSSDFTNKECVVDYTEGSSFALQPDEFSNLSMSLWNTALEVHTGRIYMSSLASFIFIFFVGLFVLWCLISGYILRLRKKYRN